MTVYAYRGRTGAGAVAGELEATDRMAAVAQLRSRGVVATAVQEKKAKTGGFTFSFAKTFGGRVSDKDMAIYTRQFSTMVDAGLPIAQCLTILGEQSESKTLREVTTNIAHDVEGGATLADSFRKFPKTFDDLYIEKAAALKRKVKSAMVYPATIISVAVLVIIFMMTFVIPTFASMFRNMGAELPLPTKIVLMISDFTRQYVLFILAAMAGFVFAFRKYYSTDQGSQVIDALLLKVPIVGMLIRKVAVARFTRTLGTLISSGVPILEGLRITARSAGNRLVEKAVMSARAAVTAGRTLAEPLRASPVFPPMVVHMISVGENTGALDQMLGKIADFYDDEVDAAVSALTSLLEPLMIVFLGVIVGGLVVAMYLPIFRMVTLIK